MTARTEALRAIGVFNIHNALSQFGVKGKTDVGIYFRRHGRATHGGWLVFSPSHATDPKAHFLDNGCKMFGSCTRNVLTLETAKKWAAERYGIAEWARGPAAGDWIPKSVADAISVAMKAAKRASVTP